MATCNQCGRWKFEESHCAFCAKDLKEFKDAVRRFRDEVEAAAIMHGFTVDDAEINKYLN
jgi:hypothetical protein